MSASVQFALQCNLSSHLNWIRAFQDILEHDWLMKLVLSRDPI